MKTRMELRIHLQITLLETQLWKLCLSALRWPLNQLMKKSHREEKLAGMTSVINKLNRETCLLNLKRDRLIKKNLFKRSMCLRLRSLALAGGMQAVVVVLEITKSLNHRLLTWTTTSSNKNKFTRTIGSRLFSYAMRLLNWKANKYQLLLAKILTSITINFMIPKLKKMSLDNS